MKVRLAVARRRGALNEWWSGPDKCWWQGAKNAGVLCGITPLLLKGGGV